MVVLEALQWLVDWSFRIAIVGGFVIPAIVVVVAIAGAMEE
jgi:hypothetical protein